jgi:hypothetical protein
MRTPMPTYGVTSLQVLYALPHVKQYTTALLKLRVLVFPCSSSTRLTQHKSMPTAYTANHLFLYTPHHFYADTSTPYGPGNLQPR